jgi:hypothetical protein
MRKIVKTGAAQTPAARRSANAGLRRSENDSQARRRIRKSAPSAYLILKLFYRISCQAVMYNSSASPVSFLSSVFAKSSI